MHRRALLLATAASIFLAATFATACGGGDGGDGLDDNGKPIIVATTVQIGALAQEVGGDRIALSVLIGPGVDPHDYELTAGDRRRVDQAKVVLRNGLGLDKFLDSVVENGKNKSKAVTVSDGIKLNDGDPHVWQNIPNNKVMVDNIAEALARADPDNASTYRENGAAYQLVLDKADVQIRATINSIPEANRKMVTNHDAFGYFIEEYGLTFVGAVIPATTTQAEPSAKDIAALVETIKREKVLAIFAESSVDPKVAEQISKDTGVKIVDDLYGDSLGAPGSGAETVHGMLLQNAQKIAEALK